MGRRERKKAQLRKRLYEVAIELFSEHGFAETTVEQITQRVDVSPATFFNYFATKQAVLADYHRATTVTALEFARTLGERSVRERFLAIAQWQERRAETEGRLFKIMLQEFLSHPESLVQNTDVAMELFTLLRGWVAEGQQIGAIRKDLDPSTVVHAMANIWNGTMLEWAAGGRRALCAGGIVERIALLFDGIAK